MAKIVYGVSGEGSGHSSRSREMAKHLVEKGHEVKIVSYDRGVKNLRDEFGVFETEGLHIACANSRISKVKTFSKEGFLDDLASSKAVMATAGFTLMTESFYYRKPFMALPMKGQFEQEINGILMTELGYGKNLTISIQETDINYRLDHRGSCRLNQK